jgi:hypothetical protein
VNGSTIKAVLDLIAALAKIATDARDPKTVPARVEKLWATHRSSIVRAAEEDRVRRKFGK